MEILLACAKDEGHGSDKAQAEHLEAKDGLVQRLQIQIFLSEVIQVFRLPYLQL